MNYYYNFNNFFFQPFLSVFFSAPVRSVVVFCFAFARSFVFTLARPGSFSIGLNRSRSNREQMLLLFTQRIVHWVWNACGATEHIDNRLLLESLARAYCKAALKVIIYTFRLLIMISISNHSMNSVLSFSASISSVVNIEQIAFPLTSGVHI